ncbi:MAG: UPF0280 family protein, partial [bacterium]|nr:UPF0280 family protein [bacterium]
VTVKETDLFIHAEKTLEKIALDLVLECRGHMESYIEANPDFAATLVPWQAGIAPSIIRKMSNAGKKAGVGPMAAVAGAIAGYVGRGLLKHTDQVIVENGGDVFIKKNGPATVAVYAGKSPLSLKIGIGVDAGPKPVAVCTSSGTVGHSLSLGKADAVCVVSGSCALADAAATSIGNTVASKNDIEKAVDYGKSIEGVDGLVVIIGDKIGVWGDLSIQPLQTKKQV